MRGGGVEGEGVMHAVVRRRLLRVQAQGRVVEAAREGRVAVEHAPRQLRQPTSSPRVLVVGDARWTNT